MKASYYKVVEVQDSKGVTLHFGITYSDTYGILDRVADKYKVTKESLLGYVRGYI